MDINEQLALLEKKNAIINGATWKKFPSIGDFIQGILLTRKLSVSPGMQKQIVYVIKNDEGLWNVAFNATYPIHKSFAGALVGQAAKIAFTSTKPHALNPIKIYTVTTSPEILDETQADWLEENGLKIGDPLALIDETGEGTEGLSLDEFAKQAEEEATPEARPVGSSLPKVKTK